MNSPTAEQRAAIECPDLDILVEAGAGTGKTSTTVARYERLLGELEPSQVLVFTFTEKAATELRERVREMRERSGREFSMGSTWIGTFHSVCARILRAHPIAADVDPGFTVADDVQSDRLKQRAWDAAMGRTVEAPGAEMDLARFNRRNLREGVQHAYERLRAIGMLRPELQGPPPQRSRVDIHAELMEEALLASEVQGIRAPTPQKIDDLIGWLRSIQPDEISYAGLSGNAFSSSSKKIASLMEALSRAASALAAIDFGDRTWNTLRHLLIEYGEEYDAVKRSQGCLDYEDLQLKTLAMLNSSPAVAAAYRGQFREIMVDEFQDTNQLQMDLISALREPGVTTLFTVGDEMQAIYSFRFADVRLFRDRREGADNPVTVLPLSANFRSEPAVIGAVNRIGREFEGLIEDLRCSDEPGEIAGGTAHQFADLRAGREPSAGVEPGVEMMFTARKAWRDTPLGPLHPGRPEDEPEDEKGSEPEGQHEAEALAVAQRIRELIEEEKVEPGQIVILFRSRTRMWLFEEALKQTGIRSYTVGGSRFWETREGVDLRSLLGVIANPLDDEALIGSLAGPTCGIGADSLLRIGGDRNGSEPIWPRLVDFAEGKLRLDGDGDEVAGDVERAARFVATIKSARASRARLPLGRLIENAVTGTGYDLVNLRRDPGGTGLANIRHVFDIADGFEVAAGRDLRGLIEWIDASADLDAEAAVASADEDSNVVRLMTSHKSKGLEFDVVFVADLGKKASSQSEKVIWVSPGLDRDRPEFGLRVPKGDGGNIDIFGWSTLQDRAALDNTDEELRVLHVAMTRAKRRLILSGLVNLEKPASPSETCSMADRLADAFEISLDDPDLIEIAGPERLEQGQFWPPSMAEIKRIGPAEAEWMLQQAIPGSVGPDRPDGGTALARQKSTLLPEIPLSYSTLAGFVKCPAKFYATRILRLSDPTPGGRIAVGDGIDAEIELDENTGGATDRETLPRPRPDATHFGNAVHLMLEKMAGRSWRVLTDPEIEKHLKAEQAGSGEAEIDRARRMLSEFVQSKLGQELKKSRVQVESNLLLESGGAIIRGYVDLIATTMDPPLVLDYKTNRLDGASPSSKMAGYELQRDLYALGVSRATGADRIATAFVFLEDPDRPVRDLYDPPRLADAADRIGRLIAEIRRGHFLGESDAEHKPCGACWACELLAPRILAISAG